MKTETSKLQRWNGIGRIDSQYAHLQLEWAPDFGLGDRLRIINFGPGNGYWLVIKWRYRYPGKRPERHNYKKESFWYWLQRLSVEDGDKWEYRHSKVYHWIWVNDRLAPEIEMPSWAPAPVPPSLMKGRIEFGWEPGDEDKPGSYGYWMKPWWK